MSNGQCSENHGCSAVARAGMSRTGLRAVAFEIDGKIYAGSPGESHAALYAQIKRSRRVPQRKLDTWTACEEDNGFVTETGEFLKRAEAFTRCGIRRSQDLTA